jgi:2-polyprenyl-3-methyl-5-hydroxy-6-metoxy-1,4-benzoquinol methylase
MSGRRRSLRQLLTDRLAKHGLYDTPGYWDMKAEQYQGLARSNWPSNAYNRELHAYQMQAIDRILGDVSGLSVADVGCGTGRASLHLARRGARVHGFDFSPKALAVARQDAQRRQQQVVFSQANVMEPPAPEHVGQFDIVLSLGCLTLACGDRAAFEQALANLIQLLRPDRHLLFVEPIHSSRLLTRILRMGVAEWIDRCEQQGLRLTGRGGLMLVPVRYALAFRELPPALVAPLFHAGERLLTVSARLERFADYKWLLFRTPARHSTPAPAW